MDHIDEQLLALLRDNARAPVSSLAAHLGIARTTLQARIDRLERDGIIQGYTVRIDPQATAPMIRATVLLSIDPAKQNGVLARLRALDSIRSVVSASGRVDLVLHVATRSTEALDDLLDRIGAIDGVKTSESLIHLSSKLDRG